MSDRDPKTSRGKQAKVEPDFSFINASDSVEESIRQNQPEVCQPTWGSAPVVMVVDDNDLVLQLICSALEEEGYVVLSAASGDKALELFKAHKEQIPLVILDECLPRISGRELLKQIHQLAPKTRIILTSGYYGDNERPPEVNREYGVFLHKPYEIPHLLDVVKRFMTEASVSR